MLEVTLEFKLLTIPLLMNHKTMLREMNLENHWLNVTAIIRAIVRQNN